VQKIKTYWWCQLLGWLAMITVELVNYTFFIIGKFDKQILIYFSICAFIGFTLTHLFKLLIHRFQVFQKSKITIWLLALFSSLSIAVLISIVVVFINAYMIYAGKITFSWIEFLGNIMNWMRYVTVWVIIYFMYKLVLQNSLLQQQKLQAENIANVAELELLKSQLNPHFLFNALNSIKALISIDQEKSRNAVLLLSDLLRFTLNYGKDKEIPLLLEIDEVKKYFQLESIRFGEKLKIDFDIDENAYNYFIPPAIVLTLAENAIKHGKIAADNRLHVILIIQKTERGIYIEIKNTGKLHSEALNNTGVGLALVKKRLEALYLQEASLHLKEEENWVSVSIQINGNDNL